MDLTEQLTPPAIVLEILAKSLNFGALGRTPRPSSAEKAYINGVRELGMHKYDKASECLADAVKISENEKDSSEADLELYTFCIGALGFARAGQGNITEALSLYQQTLPCWEKIHGKNSPKITCVHTDLALLLESTGKTQEAFESLKSIRQTMAETHGADSVDVQGLTLAMASNLSRRQQLEDAEDLYSEAIKMLRLQQRPELSNALSMYYEHLQAYSKTEKAKEIKAELANLNKSKR